MWELGSRMLSDSGEGQHGTSSMPCEKHAVPRTERRVSNSRWHRVGVCAGADSHNAVADGPNFQWDIPLFCPRGERNQGTPVSLCRSGSFCTEANLHKPVSC
ncbi:hypothetical protein CCMA1212_007258 [Trichoderma ghanense]|uniref:Uncharacterized protein n=1 Tax=Trichoderma ghanense TaxID=65468 RepID=A0ABY2GYA9_9HYPO